MIYDYIFRVDSGPNFQTLVGDLYEVRSEWYLLGVLIGVSVSTLDTLTASGIEIDIKYAKMLNAWKNTGNENYGKIVNAVHMLGKINLAKKIANKYGKLHWIRK